MTILHSILTLCDISRAAFGDLARALEADYGRGFAEKNLRRMVQFAEAFPDAEIVATLSRQLSWSQFVLVLPVKDALAREFYAEMCRVESWNVRTLRTKIQGMLFERTSLSRKPEKLARQELATLRSEDRMTPDIVFRDPYLLDFVGLRGAFSEKDLETALVRELGDFISDAPELHLVSTKSRHEVIPPTAAVPLTPRSQQWTKGAGVVYGAPISFRGLRHAPINEQGVVFLFGMVSYEIGFIVEAVHAAYPDCEAKRCVDRRNERWQRVRIEFEFCSSNFRDHGHDPSGCDVIVCWEHDWPDCPLEVVELRRVINELEG